MFLRCLLALLFIIRLRFPRNRNFIRLLEERYGRLGVQTLRKCENDRKKLEKAKLDLQFLSLCLYHEVYPRFLRIRLYREGLYDTALYKKFQFDLLEVEINSKRKLCESLCVVVASSLDAAKRVFSRLDYVHFESFVDASVAKYVNDIERVHERKLNFLNVQGPLFNDPEKVIINLSAYNLSSREKFLLALGLDFNLPVFNFNYFKYFLCIEKILLSVRKLQGFKVNFDVVCNKVRDVARSCFYSKKTNFHPFIQRDDLSILRKLGRNKDLVFCNPDKGRGVVILNRCDYINKMNIILSDREKFEAVQEDKYKLSLRLEDKLNRKLRTLKSQGILNEEMYDKLFCSGTTFGMLYGSPKSHKLGCPLRPVMAAYNSHNFNLAKYFFNPLLRGHMFNQFSVKNSYEFSDLIGTLPHDKFMVSYDVSSLFTNIPLMETINIIADLVYGDVNDDRVVVDRDVFVDLLKLAVLDTYFVFDGAMYKQKDGVAMGSPLGPIFANIFMNHLEEEFLISGNIVKPLVYRRYVDDIFCMFDSEMDADIFLNFINGRHPNIQFTIEKERDSKLAFLDVLVSRGQSGLNTAIYRKTMFTGQGINFFSFCSLNFRLNACHALINRAYKICTSYGIFHDEIVFLHAYFRNNGFSSNVFYNQIRKYLNMIYNPKAILFTVPRDVRYFKLPYVGKTSLDLKKKLGVILRFAYPQIDFRLIMYNDFKIGSFFRYKDKLNALLCSCVVYQFNCPRCEGGIYIGSTARCLKTRMCAHAGISHRTMIPLSTPEMSPIRSHLVQCKVKFKFENFEILAQTDRSSLLILESLHIKKKQPLLNDNVQSVQLFAA